MHYVAAETCGFFSLKGNLKNAGPLKNLRCSRNTATHILELVEGPQIGQKCYTIFEHAREAKFFSKKRKETIIQ